MEDRSLSKSIKDHFESHKTCKKIKINKPKTMFEKVKMKTEFETAASMFTTVDNSK
jgi:hypothetical protein